MWPDNIDDSSLPRHMGRSPLKNPVDLFHSAPIVKICAPMVRYSKLPFRTLVRKYDCDLCYTPMIIAADFVRSLKARHSEFTTNQGDHPLIVQFAAKEAQVLADAAGLVSPFADGVDINCGCPQRWAMAEGYGACLINKPQLIQEMVRSVRNQVENPTFSVSIKIRIHEDLKRTVDLCQKAESTGVSWISVHGRSVEERHQPVHYDAIRTIKDSISIPVVANGDVKSLKDVAGIHQRTGADGVVRAMTYQWGVVAAFLYGEIALLLLLCLPLVSPVRWNKIFMISVWNKIASYWNKTFLTIIVILIVLFLDAVREVRKYSTVQLNEDSPHSSHNAIDHIHMKLFRSQRNLYISGFSLFLWLVLRRLVSLITLLANEMETENTLKIEVANSNEVARKCLEENEKLQLSLKEMKHSTGEHLCLVTNEKLTVEVEQLKTALKATSEALLKTRNEIITARKHSEELKKEYDLLVKEHEKLQQQTTGASSKKDL
ncbi:tRNA-dihydrouridine(20a/20b) synthase [NAD(P)+]-like isoform X3 [Ahaetulla prasina]|uniref:tRNA-dihydrouridine(20a/20b) synthase [NAD(P)+]-like isoform X3 n=2 Tax=Ahaetulla prasina TaxID=499056 RepID=UPI0026498C4A|nr:tRNA-dihydrouridine(20a/20b) synthase [NAD(P)+]-like isoform X3 [Ahaetulla prasina]